MDEFVIPYAIDPETVVTVIDDGRHLMYGTKQRVTPTYVAEMVGRGYQEFIYVGPVNAMGAYALAYGCVKNNVRATLFLVGTRLPGQACGFPSSVVFRLMRMSMKEAEQQAEAYVNQAPERVLIPFGINDPLYVSLLESSLLSDLVIVSLRPKRMWLTVGSGVLLKVLLRIFPETEFHVVQVGKALKLENLELDTNMLVSAAQRVHTYWAPERFTDRAEFEPPYSSLINYDAKVWRFVSVNGQNGDFVWNVARDFPSSCGVPERSRRGRSRGRQGRGRQNK